jgi:transcriptional regulator with XRE-family HTH domain
MTDELQSVLAAVGPRLRALRKQRGVTLEQLAESTEISVSTLSRLESGQRRPTLELLLPIARAHHVPLDELVGAPMSGDPRVYPRPIHRSGATWLPLTRNPGGPAVFKQIIQPRPDPSAAGPCQLDRRSHEGHEWFYVIAGRLRLTLGDKDFILAAGEAAEFDTRIPHLVTNAGLQPLELLSIFGPQGERVHLRGVGRGDLCSLCRLCGLCRGSARRQAHHVGVEVDAHLGSAGAAVFVLIALPRCVPDLPGEAALHQQHELHRGPVDALVQARVTPVLGCGEQRGRDGQRAQVREHGPDLIVDDQSVPCRAGGRG